MKKRQSHPLLKLFLGVTLGICIVFLMYLFFGRPFTINNDQIFEYTALYQEWIELIENWFMGKGLPMYSWHTFLGNDFYASMAFYTTGDLFLPLYFIFQDVPRFLFVETILCIYISAFSMYFFLKEAGIKKVGVRHYTSMLYAFGGWGVLFIGQYMFHRFYAFVPLLFFGVEYYHNHKKGWPMVLAVAILFYHCFYYMYPLSLFLLFYCIVRENEWKQKGKAFFKDAGMLLGYYIIGFLLAGFLAVPAVLYIVSNPRVAHVRKFSLFWPLKVTLGYLISFISAPFPLYSKYANLFQIEDNAYGYWYSQFVTILTLCGAFAFGRKNKGWGILLIGLIVSVLVLPLSSMLHGFSDPSMRWNFVIQFLILFLGARYFEENEVWGNRQLAKNYVIGCAVIVILLPLFDLSLFQYWIHYVSLLVCLTLAWFTLHLDLKRAYWVSLGQVILYASLMVHTWYVEIPDFSWRMNASMMGYLQDTDTDLRYRYHIDMKDVVPAGLNLNISLQNHFLSAKTYESTYDTNVYPFLSFLGIDEIRLDINDSYALTALGTKYWLAKSESDLPKELEFTYFANLSDLNVYENQSYHGFGYTLSHIEPFSNLTESKQLLDTLFVEDDFVYETYEGGGTKPFMIEAYATNYLSGSITLDKPNLLYIAIPNNDGWTVRDNGEILSTIPVNGGFMGIPLEAGEHHIELNFMTPGLKVGVVCSGVGFLLFLALVIYENRRKRGS